MNMGSGSLHKIDTLGGHLWAVTTIITAIATGCSCVGIGRKKGGGEGCRDHEGKQCLSCQPS